jgi:hypothetical protein
LAGELRLLKGAKAMTTSFKNSTFRITALAMLSFALALSCPQGVRARCRAEFTVRPCAYIGREMENRVPDARNNDPATIFPDVRQAADFAAPCAGTRRHLE